MRIM